MNQILSVNDTSDTQQSNENNTEKQTNNKKASKKRDRSPSNNLNDTSKKSTNINNAVNNNLSALQNNNNISSTTSTVNTTTTFVQGSANALQTTLPNTTSNSQATPLVTIAPTAAAAVVNKKEKQRPETWHKIEQQIFFNALRQNGKNFEAITQYFNTRQKRYKIDFVQRSKEQIRHFYYRTWHKIIKYVTIPNDQPIRDIQVNCLIAFNALMNKSHKWNKKSAHKLVELINHGWTTVREKGKITRLRMPICKLTKNVTTNNVESNTALPQFINVTLQPKNEIAFCRVQKLAQNPYLSIDLQSTQTVKYLISFLENKWKDRRLQFFERISFVNEDENNVNSNYQFVLYPDESHSLSNLEIESNLGLATTSNNIHEFETFDHQDQQQLSGTSTTGSHITSTNDVNALTSTQQSTAIKIRLKSSDENESPKQYKKNLMNLKEQAQIQQQQLNETNLNDSQMLVDDEDGMLTSTEDEIDKDETSKLPITSNAISETIGTTTVALSTSKKLNPGKGSNNKKATQYIAQNQSNIYRTQLNIEQIKTGLTSKSDVTFIQLYLAMNRPNTIKLKYEWVPIKPENASITNDDVNSIPNSSVSCFSIQQQSLINVELIDKQRFYIQVLSKIAGAYLSDLKAQNEMSADNRSSKNDVNGNNNGSKKSTANSNAGNNNNNKEQNTIISSNNFDEANKAPFILQDISSKARKRKAIVVKSTRPGRDSCESPTTIGMPMSVMSTSSSSTATSMSLVNTPNSNIVVSAPVAGVARQIVNTTNDSFSNYVPQRKNSVISNTTNNINSNSGQVTHPNNNNNTSTLTTDNNNLLSSTQEQHQQQQLLVNQQSLQNYSNLIPQILTFLHESSDNAESGYSESNCTYNDTANVILHSNLVLSDEQNLIPPIHSMQHEQMQNNNNQQQQHHILSGSNVDLSLIDLSLNNDSVFGLGENSNMSTLSCLLNSLQCKTIQNTSMNNPIKPHEPTSNQNIPITHTFVIPSTSTITTSTSTINSTTTTSTIQFNNSVNKLGNSGSFKRSDTLEWNDSLSDISLSSFLNEMQSPEKRTLLNLINENSRDSFFNMDTMMNIIPYANRYDDHTNQNPGHPNNSNNLLCKLNNQTIDTTATSENTSTIIATPIAKN